MDSKYKFVFKKISSNEIDRKRQNVMECLIQKSATVKNTKISSISTKDLYLLFDLYNDIFLDNKLKGAGIIINFSLSRRMTRSAGKTIYEKKTQKNYSGTFEIRIATDFFFNYDLTRGHKLVCGIETKNSLVALLLVFEHELCHVIERLCFGYSNCSKERYKEIAYNLFGHKASHHQLPTHRQIASECLNLGIGDIVTFNFEGEQVKGVINRINKRATVMVKSRDGDYQDKQGNCYKKYYVPLELLSK